MINEKKLINVLNEIAKNMEALRDGIEYHKHLPNGDVVGNDAVKTTRDSIDEAYEDLTCNDNIKNIIEYEKSDVEEEDDEN